MADDRVLLVIFFVLFVIFFLVLVDFLLGPSVVAFVATFGASWP